MRDGYFVLPQYFKRSFLLTILSLLNNAIMIRNANRMHADMKHFTQEKTSVAIFKKYF